MGCSSSTAIGTNQPTRICYTYAGLKDLCTGPKGGFGCFLEKKNLSKPLLDIIRTQYDVILQYPKDLRRATKLQADSTTKKKMGKHFKHKEILLTDESKEEFLSTLMELNQDITGFKVFFKRQTDNTFNSEILRYRELIENHQLQDISPVKALEFTPISQANNTDISNLKAKYISFSIKRKQQTGTSPKTLMLLNRIDFIFLETCLPPIPINKRLTKINIHRFIKTMITDLQQLHQNGI